MIWLVSICAAMLFIAAVLVLYRVEKGPTTLDRMVSVDVMTSILLGALALLAAVTRRSDLLAVFVVVSVVGFLGSVAISRAARMESPEYRRILTLEEDRLMKEAEEAADEADQVVHDVDVDAESVDETAGDFHVGPLVDIGEHYANMAIWRERPSGKPSEGQSKGSFDKRPDSGQEWTAQPEENQ